MVVDDEADDDEVVEVDDDEVVDDEADEAAAETPIPEPTTIPVVEADDDEVVDDEEDEVDDEADEVEVDFSVVPILSEARLLAMEILFSPTKKSL